MKSTLKNINYCTPTHLRYSSATPTRYSFTLWGTVTLKRYSYTYDVQLLLGGKATPMKTATFKSTLRNIFRRLLNYLQFFLYNNENRLMLIKRWRLIIRQNNNDANLAESETNRLILLQTHLKFRRTVPLNSEMPIFDEQVIFYYSLMLNHFIQIESLIKNLKCPCWSILKNRHRLISVLAPVKSHESLPLDERENADFDRHCFSSFMGRFSKADCFLSVKDASWCLYPACLLARLCPLIWPLFQAK